MNYFVEEEEGGGEEDDENEDNQGVPQQVLVAAAEAYPQAQQDEPAADEVVGNDDGEQGVDDVDAPEEKVAVVRAALPARPNQVVQAAGTVPGCGSYRGGHCSECCCCG